jgi:hypothetical protein
MTSDFWSLLHKLALELENLGEDAGSQAAALVEQMNTMPQGVINAHVANLELTSAVMIELLNRARTE